jgi:hypothetical protein
MLTGGFYGIRINSNPFLGIGPGYIKGGIKSPSTISILVQPRPNGSLRVVVQGFMKAQILGKHAAMGRNPKDISCAIESPVPSLASGGLVPNTGQCDFGPCGLIDNVSQVRLDNVLAKVTLSPQQKSAAAACDEQFCREVAQNIPDSRNDNGNAFWTRLAFGCK